MNLGFIVFTALVLTPNQSGGLSTDRLDEYVQKVQNRRNACGPTAVWFCLNQFGIPADRDDLCRDAELGPAGTSLKRLLELSEQKGLKPNAINSVNKDVRLIPVPSILVVDGAHCVVYLGTVADSDEVQYYEPATNRVLTAPREKVERNWTGETIVFNPTGLTPVAFYSIVTAIAAIVISGGVIFSRLF